MDLPELSWPISGACFERSARTPSKCFDSAPLLPTKILFGGRLVILDSDYINSLALRNSVIRTLHNAPDEHSSFFRTLIDERYLLIACRQENSLGEVAEQLGKRGGHDLIRLFAVEGVERGASVAG
jgi:hypothetical protein